MGEAGRAGKLVLFVGTKSPAQNAVKAAAEKTGQWYVATRWIGGFLTNWNEVKKRIERLATIKKEESEGLLEKYTKKEQLRITKEKEDLLRNFGGVEGLEKRPDVLFVVDPLEEEIAVAEARQIGIPVIALANSDCDFSLIDYPIPANDAARATIEFIVEKIALAYNQGKKDTIKTPQAPSACPLTGASAPSVPVAEKN